MVFYKHSLIINSNKIIMMRMDMEGQVEMDFQVSQAKMEAAFTWNYLVRILRTLISLQSIWVGETVVKDKMEVMEVMEKMLMGKVIYKYWKEVNHIKNTSIKDKTIASQTKKSKGRLHKVLKLLLHLMVRC